MKKLIFFYDTETSNYEADGVTPSGKFVAGAITGLTGKTTILRDPLGFLDHVAKIAKKQGEKTATIYCHNLAFETAGFWRYFEKIKPDYAKKIIPICSGRGMLISFAIFWHGVYINFQDSYMLTLLKLADFEKAFGLNVSKAVGSWDYAKFRDTETMLSDDEIDYMIRDVLVLRAWYKKMRPKYITAGSTAFHNWLDFFTRENPDCLKQSGKPDLKTYVEGWGDPEMQRLLKGAYVGGYVFIKPELAGVVVKDTTAIDINSSYPSSMCDEFPAGKMIRGLCSTKSSFQKIVAVGKLKPGCFPTVKTVGKMAEYDTEINIVKGRWFTERDAYWLRRNYDLNYETIVDSVDWDSWKTPFKGFVTRNYLNKQNAKNEFEKFEAKLNLNSLYGKFGQTIVDDTWGIVDGVAKITELGCEISKTNFVAWAAIITSKSRDKLFSTIEKIGYDKFVYADTDSITTTATIDEIKAAGVRIHEKELGAWSLDGIFSESKFVRPKTYKCRYANSQTVKLRCAGYNGAAFDNPATLDDLFAGAEANDKRGRKKTEFGFAILDNLPFRVVK